MTVIKKITENKNIITSSVLTAVLCGFLYFENKCLTVGKYIEESLKISENNDGFRFAEYGLRIQKQKAYK